MDEQHEDGWVKQGSVRMGAGVAPLLLTIPQAASVLAVGRTTVYELIGAGDLEAVHIGRSARVPVASIELFVARRRGQHGAARGRSARQRDVTARARVTSRRLPITVAETESGPGRAGTRPGPADPPEVTRRPTP